MAAADLSAGRRWLVLGLICTAATVPAAPGRAAPSRFASFGSEAECAASQIFTATVCHTAFGNAEREYESKTPVFPSEALCRRRFATCMAWPPGAAPGKGAFRPSWDGVDIVDTPNEHSVTPSPGSTGRAIRFAARPLTEEPRALTIRGSVAVAPSAPAAASRPMRRAGLAPERAPAPSAPPPPGSGFTLENGVLTYPAPARFQPRNLPKYPN